MTGKATQADKAKRDKSPDPEIKQDAGKKPKPENTRQQGETANIRQNTQIRQKNR